MRNTVTWFKKNKKIKYENVYDTTDDALLLSWSWQEMKWINGREILKNFLNAAIFSLSSIDLKNKWFGMGLWVYLHTM